MGLRISIDSGGTFTDGVLVDDTGRALTAKAHTARASSTASWTTASAGWRRWTRPSR